MEKGRIGPENIKTNAHSPQVCPDLESSLFFFQVDKTPTYYFLVSENKNSSVLLTLLRLPAHDPETLIFEYVDPILYRSNGKFKKNEFLGNAKSINSSVNLV